MTDAMTVRKAVHSFVKENPQAAYDEVVKSVCDETGATEKQVCDEVDNLEANGFLYLVESDETTEVKVA